MTINRSSATAPTTPTTYNGQQFEAPGEMTRLWAIVSLMIGAGLLAIAAGIAGAVMIDMAALGAGLIVGVPFIAFGLLRAHFTLETQGQVYPKPPKPVIVATREYDDPGEAGHVILVQGKPGPVLHDTPAMAKPAPNLVHFPVCANDVLYVLNRGAIEGLGFRAWTGHKLPSGAKPDRNTWIAIQDGLIRWQFATSRQTQTGRVVELRQDVDLDAMLDAVRKGATKP